MILCTGVKDRPVSLPGAKAVAEAGLLPACPVCDGYEFTGKRIGVIGNSLHGVREAAFLRTFSNDVGFIDLTDKTDPAMDLELAGARIRRTRGIARHLALGSDHTVFVTTDDGAGHRQRRQSLRRRRRRQRVAPNCRRSGTGRDCGNCGTQQPEVSGLAGADRPLAAFEDETRSNALKGDLP